MKQGKSIVELAAELNRQQTLKRDFIADTRKVEMTVPMDARLIDATLDKRTDNFIPKLAIPTNGHSEYFTISETAHSQIAQRLSIPKAYYDRMLQAAPDLLADNVNHWLSNNPEKRMIRTLDGNARAFLSERYRCLDNYDLANAVLPIFNDAGMPIEIHSCEVTERRMYIKALFPRIQGEVAKGDVVQSGIVISNSEIGHGSLRVEPLLFRLVCLNGMISATALKKYHVGRANDDANDGAIEIFRDETLAADDKAFWMKVQDTVRASLNDIQFKKSLDQIKIAQGMIIDISPVEVVERAHKSFNLTEGEKDNVLTHLIKGGDLSAWGLCNAVTRTSQDVESYDRATELERLGGQIIELPKTDWQRLAA